MLLCAAHIVSIQALFFHNQFALTHLSSASCFLWFDPIYLFCTTRLCSLQSCPKLSFFPAAVDCLADTVHAEELWSSQSSQLNMGYLPYVCEGGTRHSSQCHWQVGWSLSHMPPSLALYIQTQTRDWAVSLHPIFTFLLVHGSMPCRRHSFMKTFLSPHFPFLFPIKINFLFIIFWKHTVATLFQKKWERFYSKTWWKVDAFYCTFAV